MRFVSLTVSTVSRVSSPTEQAQAEVVAIFVRLAQKIGFPRSIGALYGLLFASDRPLAADEMRATLGLSLGATSQGLRALQAMRAVRPVQISGERKRYYEAEVELRRLSQGIAREVVDPHLHQLDLQLQRLRHQTAVLSPAEAAFFDQRVDKLERWNSLGRRWLHRLHRLLTWTR